MCRHLSAQHKAPRFLRALRLLWRLARDPAYRHMMALHWWPRPGVFQPFNDTRPDRYPAIFKFVQAQLGAGASLDLLSFGCATGEEVFSLRRYFPRARIKGIDVNPGNIAAARRQLDVERDGAMTFVRAASTVDERPAQYDAIFCMAVLRHGSLGRPGTARCDPLLRFEDFARVIADFHRCLRPGGLLVVRHSNFRVCDTPTGARFEAVLSVHDRADDKTPIFGPDNRLMPDADGSETVFRKRA